MKSVTFLVLSRRLHYMQRDRYIPLFCIWFQLGKLGIWLGGGGGVGLGGVYNYCYYGMLIIWLIE